MGLQLTRAFPRSAAAPLASMPSSALQFIEISDWQVALFVGFHFMTVSRTNMT